MADMGDETGSRDGFLAQKVIGLAFLQRQGARLDDVIHAKGQPLQNLTISLGPVAGLVLHAAERPGDLAGHRMDRNTDIGPQAVVVDKRIFLRPRVGQQIGDHDGRLGLLHEAADRMFDGRLARLFQHLRQARADREELPRLLMVQHRHKGRGRIQHPCRQLDDVQHGGVHVLAHQTEHFKRIGLHHGLYPFRRSFLMVPVPQPKRSRKWAL